MGEWTGGYDDFGYIPSSIAKIINEKEGENRLSEKDYEIVKNANSYFTNTLTAASNCTSSVVKDYKPKNKVISEKIEDVKCDRLWFPNSRYNLDRLVYGRLYASIYKTSSNRGIIIEETSKIYSWSNYLTGYHKAQYLNWFQIRNIDDTHSKLTFSFNLENIKIQYIEYLRAIAYCIDNGISH